MDDCKYKPTLIGPFGTKEGTTGFRYRNNHDDNYKRTKQPNKPYPLQKTSRPSIQIHWHDIMCNWFYKLPSVRTVKPEWPDELEPYY